MQFSFASRAQTLLSSPLRDIRNLRSGILLFPWQKNCQRRNCSRYIHWLSRQQRFCLKIR